LHDVAQRISCKNRTALWRRLVNAYEGKAGMVYLQNCFSDFHSVWLYRTSLKCYEHYILLPSCHKLYRTTRITNSRSRKWRLPWISAFAVIFFSPIDRYVHTGTRTYSLRC